jgi:hypothetical protein
MKILEEFGQFIVRRDVIWTQFYGRHLRLEMEGNSIGRGVVQVSFGRETRLLMEFQRHSTCCDLWSVLKCFYLCIEGLITRLRFSRRFSRLLHCLRMQGKRLVFVTNNSTKSRKQYGKKFESLGLSVTEVEALRPNP